MTRLGPRVLAALAFANATGIGGCRAKEEPAHEAAPLRVRCAPVERREIADVRALRGVVATPPERDAVIAAQVSGRILRVLVEEGDQVKAGALVAEVEAGPLRDALAAAEAQLAQAKASREATSSALTREEHLFERGIHARQNVETAKEQAAHAGAAVIGAKAQVDTARQNVERARVRAPLSGVVVRVTRHVGELVDGTPQAPILEVADTTELELAASAPASDLVALAPGQKAKVTFEALPGRTLDAAIRMVAPIVDANGVGAVRLSLAPSDVKPPLGLLGRAEIEAAHARPALVIPASAVRSAGAKSEVVVCADGHARVASIVIGARRPDDVTVEEGLRPGDRVVVGGGIGLEDGAAIEEAP